MLNLRRTVALATVVVAATVLPTAAQAQDAGRSGPPDRIGLPVGWLPEGITTDGKSLFSGSRADGSIR